MKLSNLHKSLCTGAIALSVVAAPMILPASATDTTAPGVDPTAPGVDSTTVVDPNYAEDDGFDWGWLGLLGLIGLAGLARKSDDRVQYREPTATTASDATGTTRSDYYR